MVDYNSLDFSKCVPQGTRKFASCHEEENLRTISIMGSNGSGIAIDPYMNNKIIGWMGQAGELGVPLGEDEDEDEKLDFPGLKEIKELKMRIEEIQKQIDEIISNNQKNGELVRCSNGKFVVVNVNDETKVLCIVSEKIFNLVK
jgi:hypothetical protein